MVREGGGSDLITPQARRGAIWPSESIAGREILGLGRVEVPEVRGLFPGGLRECLYRINIR